MLLDEINIRDPYVLLDGDTYYMYGTRAEKSWGEDDGLDCYCSSDLTNWTGPVEVFHRPNGFWADQNYWAPECHKYEGDYYLFASFKSEAHHRGTQILKSSSPLGPFEVHSSEPVTPDEWDSLDGTLYVDGSGKPYLVFAHEWKQVQDGEVCVVELTKDLKHSVGEPQVLFTASGLPQVRKIDLSQFGVEEDCYCTDGPFLYTCKDGSLLLLWSSFGKSGYIVAVAKSETGKVTGPWKHEPELLFEKDGGHAMVFKTKEGRLMLALHTPNEPLKERPAFFELSEKDNLLMREQ